MGGVVETAHTISECCSAVVSCICPSLQNPRPCPHRLGPNRVSSGSCHRRREISLRPANFNRCASGHRQEEHDSLVCLKCPAPIPVTWETAEANSILGFSKVAILHFRASTFYHQASLHLQIWRPSSSMSLSCCKQLLTHSSICKARLSRGCLLISLNTDIW
jgi:hypothetical protein